MPKLLYHIDEIALEMQHEVIFVDFHHLQQRFDYQASVSRNEIINWLVANGIPHWECSSLPSGFGSMRYRGEIYIDIAYDRDDPLYRMIESFLENPDGTMRFEGALFRGVTLESCMTHLSNSLASEDTRVG